MVLKDITDEWIGRKSKPTSITKALYAIWASSAQKRKPGFHQWSPLGVLPALGQCTSAAILWVWVQPSTTPCQDTKPSILLGPSLPPSWSGFPSLAAKPQSKQWIAEQLLRKWGGIEWWERKKGIALPCKTYSSVTQGHSTPRELQKQPLHFEGALTHPESSLFPLGQRRLRRSAKEPVSVLPLHARTWEPQDCHSLTHITHHCIPPASAHHSHQQWLWFSLLAFIPYKPFPIYASLDTYIDIDLHMQVPISIYIYLFYTYIFSFMLLTKCCAFNHCLPPQGSAPMHAIQSEERALRALGCEQHKVSGWEHTDVPACQPAISSPVLLSLTAVPMQSRATVGSSRCAHVWNRRRDDRGKPAQGQCPRAPCGAEVWSTLLREEPWWLSCQGSLRLDALPRHRICNTITSEELVWIHIIFPHTTSAVCVSLSHEHGCPRIKGTGEGNM